MRRLIRLLCVGIIWMVGSEASAQTEGSRTQCYAAADHQLDECIGWGHPIYQCKNTYFIVIDLCDKQYAE